jgi:hypothetical protein
MSGATTTPKDKGRKPSQPKGKEGAKVERILPDWELIEEHYRAGILSLRAIASQFGITEGAIRKRAKAEGWQRSLADKVRKAAREKLVRSDGTLEGTQPRSSDKDVAEKAADVIVSVARDHRSTIKRGRGLVFSLLAELQEASDNREAIEEEIEIETAGDRDGKRRAMMLKAVGLPSRAGVMLNLSAAMKNIVALERQAFNMDDAPSIETAIGNAITDAMTAREAAEAYINLVRG